jgi:CheY-like chemotaxis protein
MSRCQGSLRVRFDSFTSSSVRPRSRSQSRALSILVVDDGQDARRSIGAMARTLGAVVTLADSGQEAVERIAGSLHADRPFDVVLMDAQMPDVDGLDATRAVRAMRYDGHIIAMTGTGFFPSSREQCLAAGCDDRVEKPLSADWLEDVIARCQERSRRIAVAG